MFIQLASFITSVFSYSILRTNTAVTPSQQIIYNYGNANFDSDYYNDGFITFSNDNNADVMCSIPTENSYYSHRIYYNDTMFCRFNFQLDFSYPGETALIWNVSYDEIFNVNVGFKLVFNYNDDYFYTLRKSVDLNGSVRTPTNSAYTFNGIIDFESQYYSYFSDYSNLYCSLFCTFTYLTESTYNCFVNAEENGFTNAYNEGYSVGYDDGYNQGYDNGKVVGGNSGYTDGYDDGVSVGWINGYQEGLTNSSYQFSSLFAAIADTPVIMFRRLFGFELFGTPMLSVILSLFTLLVVLKIAKKVIK